MVMDNPSRTLGLYFLALIGAPVVGEKTLRTPLLFNDFLSEERPNSGLFSKEKARISSQFLKEPKATKKYSFRYDGRVTRPVYMVTNSNVY